MLVSTTVVSTRIAGLPPPDVARDLHDPFMDLF